VIEVFNGNWSAWQARTPAVEGQGAEAEALPGVAKREPPGDKRPPTANPQPLTPAATRRLAARVRDLEQQVTEAEREVARLHEELEAASLAADVGRVRELGARYAAAEQLLANVLAEWEDAAHEAAG
jgi:hypothetical protein